MTGKINVDFPIFSCTSPIMANSMDREYLLDKSIQIQKAECELLHPINLRARIASGNLNCPQIGPGLPRPFRGTREDLIRLATKTVNETHNSLYFNGLQLFLQLSAAIENQKTFREIHFDFDKEGLGRTCFGRHFTLLQNLKKDLDIDGYLATTRETSPYKFGHAAVIVECNDGFVLLDISSNPEIPAFVSIGFEKTLECTYESIHFTFTSSHSRSLIPLSMQCRYLDNPRRKDSFAYCLRVANGHEIAFKNYFVDNVMSDPSRIIPVCFYSRQVEFVSPDRSIGFINRTSLHKVLLISSHQAEIIFKNFITSEIHSTQKIPFTAVLEKGFLERLTNFLQPTYCHSHPDIEIPVRELYQQLISFISNLEKVKGIFRRTHLDETLENPSL